MIIDMMGKLCVVTCGCIIIGQVILEQTEAIAKNNRMIMRENNIVVTEYLLSMGDMSHSSTHDFKLVNVRNLFQ